MVLINAHSKEPTGIAINTAEEFFATEGERFSNGEEHYDFQRRYGVSGNSLKLWLDQSAVKAGISDATWSDLSVLANDIVQATASYQPSLTQTFQKDACRTFDGNDNYMHQKVYDDHTGATFWPANAGMIALDRSAAIRFGTVSLASFVGVAGTSTPYLIDIADDDGYHCLGYLAEADAAELSSNIAEDDCADDDTTDWTLSAGSLAFDVDHYEFTHNAGNTKIYLTTPVFVAGKLYKLSIDIKDGTASSISFNLYVYDGGTELWSPLRLTSGSFVTHIFYVIVGNSATGRCGLRCTADPLGNNIEFKNFSCDEVTAVGADGCHVVSTKNGSTQNWAYKDASFDFNDPAGYTFEIRKVGHQHTSSFFDSYWVYCVDPTDFPIVDKLDATNHLGYRIGVDTSDKPYCSIGDGTDTVTATWGSAISANTWYEISGGYDGTNAFICVDSGTRVTAAQSAPADSHNIYRIGYDGTNYAEGNIAIGIDSDRAVSATENQRLFNTDRARFRK